MGLLQQQRSVFVGRQRHGAQVILARGDHFHGASPDASGRAEYGDSLRLGQHAIARKPKRESSIVNRSDSPSRTAARRSGHDGKQRPCRGRNSALPVWPHLFGRFRRTPPRPVPARQSADAGERRDKAGNSRNRFRQAPVVSRKPVILKETAPCRKCGFIVTRFSRHLGRTGSPRKERLDRLFRPPRIPPRTRSANDA